MKHSAFFLLLLLFLIVFGFANSALAYIDPGSGSMLLQSLFGGIAGAVVVLKLYWRQFINLFRRSSRKESESSSSDDQNSLTLSPPCLVRFVILVVGCTREMGGF